MNGYNFTERVRRILSRAREEAAGFRHEYVGTEHILLAMLREQEGVAATALRSLGGDPDQIRDTIGNVLQAGHAGATHRGDLPYTSRAKKVLELAMNEARNLGHDYVGTEHLFLGLIREEKGIAAQVLRMRAGITEEAARAEIRRLIGIAGEPQPKGEAVPHLSDAFHTFMREAAGHAQAWGTMVNGVAQSSALDSKTAALAYIAVLAAERLTSGIPFHVKAAKAAGASREEVISAVLIGLPAAGLGVTQALPAAIAAYESD